MGGDGGVRVRLRLNPAEGSSGQIPPLSRLAGSDAKRCQGGAGPEGWAAARLLRSFLQDRLNLVTALCDRNCSTANCATPNCATATSLPGPRSGQLRALEEALSLSARRRKPDSSACRGQLRIARACLVSRYWQAAKNPLLCELPLAGGPRRLHHRRIYRQRLAWDFPEEKLRRLPQWRLGEGMESWPPLDFTPPSPGLDPAASPFIRSSRKGGGPKNGLQPEGRDGNPPVPRCSRQGGLVTAGAAHAVSAAGIRGIRSPEAAPVKPEVERFASPRRP